MRKAGELQVQESGFREVRCSLSPSDRKRKNVAGWFVSWYATTMNESVYAVIAYVARYWFAALAVVIVWRAIVWTRKDSAQVSRAQEKLPDAGYIGEWAVVASDARAMPTGTVLRASRDGWLGSARGCDVRLRNAGVPAKAARFYLREDGLHVLPQRRGTIVVDGEQVKKEAVLRHGATLTVGGVTMQLRLFAGILLEGEMPLSPVIGTAPMPVRGRRRRERGLYIEENEPFEDPYGEPPYPYEDDGYRR